jgi:hypothetical protein
MPVRQEEQILGEDSAHGTSMTIMVGPPGGLLTARMPSNVSSRRSIPARRGQRLLLPGLEVRVPGAHSERANVARGQGLVLRSE